jgi:PAS domain S-box-containing protein
MSTAFAEAEVVRALLDIVDVPIYTFDLAGRVTSWNRAAERRFGYKTEEIVGAPLETIVPAEDLAEQQAIWTRAFSGERIDPHGADRCGKDRRRAHVSITTTPLEGPSGQVIGVCEMVEESSERWPIPDAVHVQSRLIDLSDEPIFAWRIDGGIALWNSGCERLYGYSRKEALGKVSHRLLQTTQPVSLEEVFATLKAQGQWSGEVKHRTRDGTEVVVESRQQLIEAAGELLILETNRDITERRRAEAARTMLASVIESSHDAIVSKDLRGVITSWNRAAERMFGFTSSEVVGHSIRIIIPDDRQEEEDDVLRRIRLGEVVEVFDTIRRRKDGSLIPISLRVSPVRNDSGVLIGASKVARDISERKRAAARSAFLMEAGRLLAASLDYEATLAAVMNLAVPAVADCAAVDVVNEDGGSQRVAIAHVDPTKIDLARRIEARCADPASAQRPDALARSGAPVLIPVVPDDMFVSVASGDGERIDLAHALGLRSYICVPLVAHGRTVGALTLVTAESRRQYADEDLQVALDVGYRVALAIDNAQAYKDAQAANRLKDEFLATLSHELRTPLNAILGYARLLRMNMMAPERQATALETVERNGAALAKIVEDVLDVSRIISGKVRLEIQTVDVTAVVRNAIETVAPAADAKQIRVDSFINPDVGPIAGDPDRLQQIMWNLMSNAVKFTPTDGTVQVRVERAASHVEIAVSDTGIGIKPEFMPHVFERFRQGDGATTRERGGLGLGLAIVRHLVELHGGTVGAVSDGEGRGTTFVVRLPIKVVHGAPAAEERRERAFEPTNPSRSLTSLHGVRVLAVDDDADALKLVRETLEAVGSDVAVASSGPTALDAIARFRPHVLIADIGMPGMDGIELIRRIRQSPDRAIREMPAAALTAFARSEDRVASLQNGFQMHLAKPVDPAELVAVAAALARTRGAERAASSSRGRN